MILRPKQPLLAVLVALCMVCQPVLLALHLAHEAHFGVAHLAAQAHVHVCAHHHGGCSGELVHAPAADDHGHPPHCIVDHQEFAKLRPSTDLPNRLHAALWLPWQPHAALVPSRCTRWLPGATGPPRPDAQAALRSVTVLLI